MTQSFDEWYFDAKQHNTDWFTNREFYEAGQQSRQAEIDELQKRVDEVINLIEPSGEISHKLYRELIKVLKGKQDD